MSCEGMKRRTYFDKCLVQYSDFGVGAFRVTYEGSSAKDICWSKRQHQMGKKFKHSYLQFTWVCDAVRVANYTWRNVSSTSTFHKSAIANWELNKVCEGEIEEAAMGRIYGIRLSALEMQDFGLRACRNELITARLKILSMEAFPLDNFSILSLHSYVHVWIIYFVIVCKLLWFVEDTTSEIKIPIQMLWVVHKVSHYLSKYVH